MFKFLFHLLLAVILFSCSQKSTETTDRFPEGKNKKLITVDGIDVKDSELELTLFAKEPNFANPTNMDIDYRGRVWICEAYNYRNDVNNIPYKKAGDRILILEDKNGDGKSDETKVFYQGEDVNSALGIAVLGNKTFVACSPNVMVFTDTNNDDIPDKKEILFKSIGGFQSDHGLHTFVFGPDGKLYFSFGNFAQGLLDKNGNPIKDIHGRAIDQSRTPFQDGMAIRCDVDGTNFEVLGWNFRNNYELAVDSYGRIWQSDNDDDGKRANRINYVMPHGNYGYKDEMTGADWRVSRPNLEDSVNQQHWHQNDPGVIPNLAITQAGSPTGILLYEGNLLPKKYQGSLMLADAGTNELNGHLLQAKGAGFEIYKQPLLDAAGKDMWFRPSDICVSTDGSVFVADWYDAGVGGHFVGDLERGRIYRLAPKNHKIVYPKFDFESINGLVEALKNPNISVRYMAYIGLVKKGKLAESSLYELFKNENPILKARALWILTKLDQKYILEASNDADENIRATAVRIIAAQKENNPLYFEKMAADVSVQVRSAVATAIYLKPNENAWLKLANSYKSGDKWFLEALGIGATNYWDKYLPNYLNTKPNWIDNSEAKDLVWRSRAKITSELLAEIINKLPFEKTMAYFRAFDFQNMEQKNKTLLKLIQVNPSEEKSILIFKQFDENSISRNSDFKRMLPKILPTIKNDLDFVEIVSKYLIDGQQKRLFNIAFNSKDQNLVLLTMQTLMKFGGIQVFRDFFAHKPIDEKTVILAIQKFGVLDNDVMNKEMTRIFSNKQYPFKVREAAVLAMEGYGSDVRLWNLVKLNKVSKELIPAAISVFKKTMHVSLLKEYEAKFGKTEETQVANLNTTFLSQKGNIGNGKILFSTYCAACHQAAGVGTDFGPSLGQIGKKLTKESIYNAIVKPSQGISFGYEGNDIELTDGSQFQGIITSITNDKYMIKTTGQGTVTEYNKSLVKKTIPMTISLMPSFPLKDKEYNDLVEYLFSLK